jgi:hypothetical protein
MLIPAMRLVRILSLFAALPFAAHAQSVASAPPKAVASAVARGRLRVERYQGALAVSARTLGSDEFEALAKRDTNAAVLAFRRAMTPDAANASRVTGAPVVRVCPMPIAQRATGVTAPMPVLRPDSLIDRIEARPMTEHRCENPLGQPSAR